ncbi:14289_t:CDS:1, partial [Acaulospora morrowiae]
KKVMTDNCCSQKALQKQSGDDSDDQPKRSRTTQTTLPDVQTLSSLTLEPY